MKLFSIFFKFVSMYVYLGYLVILPVCLGAEVIVEQLSEDNLVDLTEISWNGLTVVCRTLSSLLVSKCVLLLLHGTFLVIIRLSKSSSATIFMCLK